MSGIVKHTRRFVQNMILCMLPVVLTTGCIVIPIPTGEKPYYSGAIPNLEVGVTSKNEVLVEFGVPDVTYRQGSELVYIEKQESWKIAWASLFLETGAGVETLHKRFALAVSFNEQDTLSAFEFDTAGDDFGDCTRHGICFGKTSSVMHYADAVSEATSKVFKPSEEQCSIYLHGPGNKKAFEASLNGNIPVNMFSTKAFIHWVTKSGRQSIVIWPDTTFLDFDCQVGEVVFVHFDYRWTGPSKLLLEDEVTGRKHISTKRLVLLPTAVLGQTHEKYSTAKFNRRRKTGSGW
jgi:hypothetical protein